VLDEQRIERDPESLGHDAPKRGLRLLRGTRADHPEAIRDAVHVRIDRDRRRVVAEDEHAVRRLRPDPRERGEFLEGTGNGPAEPVEDLDSAVPDRFRLRVVEPHLADQRLDRLRGCARERRRVGVAGEQSRARDVGHLVARPLREDGPDEHLERVLGMIAEVRPAPVARVVELAQPIQDGDPVEAVAGAHADPLRRDGVGGIGAGGAPTPGSERSGSSCPPWASRKSSPTR
jgi:hypothetical protein